MKPLGFILEDWKKYFHMCNEKLFSMKIYMAAFIFYFLSVFICIYSLSIHFHSGHELCF